MIHTKRSLGQNFFINEAQGENIVRYVLESNPNKIIEIGPGLGFFTSKFLKKGVELLAIEKDDELSKSLSALNPKNLEVINTDFLSYRFIKVSNTKYVLFGSLPYNISKKIIYKCLKETDCEKMYFIIQKEVAEKYILKNNSSNFLNIQSSIHADFKKILSISPASFKPQPKVENILIRITRNNNISFFKNINVSEFEIFLHQCFKQPKKTLNNNLKRYLIKKSDDLKISNLLNKRSHMLSLLDFIYLFKECYNIEDNEK